MSHVIAIQPDSGLEVLDLKSDSAFQTRRLHVRDVALQMDGMHRLTRAFVESPDTILQELANAAVDLCGADSAGISIEQDDRTDEKYYRWVATAGKYAHFADALLPRAPSACGICIERNQPQLFRVSQRFFDLMGVQAATVTDGILLPWQVEETRGTIWIMAHTRTEAFDGDDLRMMQVLAEFAAMGVRQRKLLLEQATAAAAAAMANELAHEINNPLQSVTNILYLAAGERDGGSARELARELSGPMDRLSSLVEKLLSLPVARIRRR